MMRSAHRPVSPHPLAAVRSPGGIQKSANANKAAAGSQKPLVSTGSVVSTRSRNTSQSPTSTPRKVPSANALVSSGQSSSSNEIKVIVVPKADAESQTNFTIKSSDEAVFVTLDELRQIKKERDSLENLLNDSVTTVELMKEKYDEVRRENKELYALLVEMEEKYKAAVEDREDFRDQVVALQTELDVSRKIEVLATSNFQQKSHLPAEILDSSRSIIRVDTELTHLQSKVAADLKTIADRAYDCLVEMEADEVDMQKKFNGVSFERKEELDPYKGLPRVKNPKVQHEPGFKFGSPSTRYPVVADNIDEEHGEEDSSAGRMEDGDGYDEDIDRLAQYGDDEYEEDQPL